MPDRPSPERNAPGTPARDTPRPLAAASSLMSSRWSRDNVVTYHPAQLYSGAVVERIGQDGLEELLEELRRREGARHTGAGRLGVFTWDVGCVAADGAPFVLQVPVALDEPGRRGRARADLPRRAFENAEYYLACGRRRFVLAPRALVALGGRVQAATFAAAPEHRALTFGAGRLRVELTDGRLSWLVELGAAATAELLAEMVAALAYHYEPEIDGGTAVADVFINDGDFLARRRADGSFDLRLATVRHREPGVGPSLLLLYLAQLVAYEDFVVGDDLQGLPALASNPSVAFEGLRRGRRYLARDLGQPEDAGAREADEWIRAFGRSREGRGYRPWTEAFLDGRLKLGFGDDLRERWWRLAPLRTKAALLELGVRAGSADEAAEREHASVHALLDRLTREMGRPGDETVDRVAFNDLGRSEMLALLSSGADVPEPALDATMAELFARWPYRSFDHLLAESPRARALRPVKGRLTFGRVIGAADQGTVRALGPPGRGADKRARSVANDERFERVTLPEATHALAARTFPSFEKYMDEALHHPAWGYYGHRVAIGHAGHFNTNPEDLSPHYGRWVANWAFDAWQELLAQGDLAEGDAFPIVEFGAGNGRLARDILDHVGHAASTPGPAGVPWARFAARLRYHVYETSAALREKQRALLGADAVVAAGDARRPAETLRRDFPGGLRGFVVTNEVPDAFGVHKIVLDADGGAAAALVLARVERSALQAITASDAALLERIRRADHAVRETFGLLDRAEDAYLDADAFDGLMQALMAVPQERREALLAASLWFEEAYVSAGLFPELAAHLAANASQYATALAAEETGVIAYVNVHAPRFIRELASALGAGFVLTIDYGETTWGLIQGARRGELPFRVYGEWQDFVPRPNDPYAVPGSQDLTADVNFTDLAAAGRAAGLHVLHYGPERDLIGDELPDVLEAARAQPSVAEFLGNPVFKALLLGTHASERFSDPRRPSQALERSEQEASKADRSSSIRRRLEGLAGSPERN